MYVQVTCVCIYTYLPTLNLLNSWDQMTWNITGLVRSGTVSSEKLCYRLAPFSHKTLSTLLLILRSHKTRILFEIISTDAIKCLDQCQKYNRARAPTFSDQAEFDELAAWGFNATTDPVTKLLYFTISPTFWIALTYKKLKSVFYF